jgi:hypothetical protein
MLAVVATFIATAGILILFLTVSALAVHISTGKAAAGKDQVWQHTHQCPTDCEIAERW